MTYTQYYRMWLPDTVEPDGGTWCYMGMDKEGYLHQLNWLYDENDAEQLDTLEQYLQWGYKIEQLCY